MRTLTLLAVTLGLIQASVSFATAPEISGTVQISPALKDKIKPEAVLYLIARQTDSGPPIAVKRITQPFQFPIEFSITARDSMMGGDTLDGKFQLSARISQSGSATPANPGDLQTAKPVKNVVAGGKAASILISEVRR
ncbi:MAG: hypothetical protein P4M08_05925 [Oligoflexia bacterium]|nr:hypothetical protein [Oligoflexia bacterium]